jgi:uncharacterized protein YbaR (Trm112 family)
VPIPKDLFDIMCCSFCKSDLRQDAERILCTNSDCGLVYSIQDDFPNMLIDEAQRPCPACGAQRDWDSERETIQCPKCGKSMAYRRG